MKRIPLCSILSLLLLTGVSVQASHSSGIREFAEYVESHLSNSQKAKADLDIIERAKNLKGYRQETSLFTKSGWAHLNGDYELKVEQDGSWHVYRNRILVKDCQSRPFTLFLSEGRRLESSRKIGNSKDSTILIFLRTHTVLVQLQQKTCWIVQVQGDKPKS